MNRPLVSVALLYVGGVLLADWLPVPPGALFLTSFALALLSLRHERGRPHWLAALVVCAGWTNLAARVAVISPADLRVLVGEKIEYVTVRGRLVETPTQSVFVRGEEESWRTHAVVAVESLGRREDWQPATGMVAVTTPGVLASNYFAGRDIRVSGVIRPPQGPVAEGLFDYRTYLRRQGIHHQLQVKAAGDWSLAESDATGATPPFADRFRNWAQGVLARGLPGEDEPLRLLWAMTLGWKTALTDEVSEPFMRSGTMHIFAISGLHIALIAGILVALLRVTRVGRGACGLFVIPLIWCYTAATGWQSSAIRSTIMMTVIIGGWALRRPSNLLNSLAASGFIILLWQPEQLFQASFQLSFFVVLSIALLMPPFEKIRDRLLVTDPFLPDDLRPLWRRWVEGLLRFVTASLATSLAAWFGSLPLIAWYFHLFTPGSLLANLLVVPVSSLALMANLGALACGDWLPPVTELFNHSAWGSMWLMSWLSRWATTLPASYFYVRPPTWPEMIFYYALVFGTVSGWLWETNRRRWAGAAVAIFAIGWLVNWQHTRGEVRATVLSHAQAIFIQEPAAADNLLVDTGSASAAGLVVKPFLHGQGVNRLPRLLLTHGDQSHIGGTLLLRKEFSIAEIITGPQKSRAPAYRELTAALAKAPEQWRKAARGDTVAGWTVLHPARDDKFPLAGESALVLRKEIHGTGILLLSDLGRPGQKILLEREPELRADIVVAGIPTQGEPLPDSLLDTCQPRALIISASDFPAAKRATRPLRERLERRAVPVFYTTDDGSLTITLRPGAWEIRSVEGKIFPGSARK